MTTTEIDDLEGNYMGMSAGAFEFPGSLVDLVVHWNEEVAGRFPHSARRVSMDRPRTEPTRQLSFPATPSGLALPGPSHHQPIALPPIERDVLECADVSLSAREHAIVFLMSHGMSNKQIARRLSIAPETVKSHVKRIFLKLTVCSRAQAVYRAAVLGLIVLQ